MERSLKKENFWFAAFQREEQKLRLNWNYQIIIAFKPETFNEILKIKQLISMGLCQS